MSRQADIQKDAAQNLVLVGKPPNDAPLPAQKGLERSKRLRTLRATTRARLKQHEASLSRLRRSFTDVRSQLQQAVVALGQTYALLERIEEISKRVVLATKRNNRPVPMAEKFDFYDHAPWTGMDIEGLTAALRSGSTIEDAAKHLGRSGTVDDVRRKAEELGLTYTSRSGQ